MYMSELKIGVDKGISAPLGWSQTAQDEPPNEEERET
jgi:hypothetical protein